MRVLSDIQAWQTASWARRIVILACLIVIAVSITSFLYNGVLRSFTNEEPDPYYFYTVGRIWNEEYNVYNYDIFRSRMAEVAGPFASRNTIGNGYPPHANVLFSLYAHGSFETGLVLMLVVNLAFIVLSLILMGKIISWFRPIGLFELTLLIAFLNTGYGRTTIRMGHVSAIIFVCLLTH
jgi:hypothetical protein